jgi:hypothetical protein
MTKVETFTRYDGSYISFIVAGDSSHAVEQEIYRLGAGCGNNSLRLTFRPVYLQAGRFWAEGYCEAYIGSRR